MPAAETFVLDTSALLSLKENEPGASEVEAILRQHGKKGAVLISFMSIMELANILEQEHGEGAARQGAPAEGSPLALLRRAAGAFPQGVDPFR